jgi:hypothetical protein
MLTLPSLDKYMHIVWCYWTMHLEYLGQHLDIPAVSIGNSNRWYGMEDYVLHSAHLSRWGLITMSFHVFSLLCYLQSIVAEISPQSHRHVLVLTQLYVGHCLGVRVTLERQAHNWSDNVWDFVQKGWFRVWSGFEKASNVLKTVFPFCNRFRLGSFVQRTMKKWCPARIFWSRFVNLHSCVS